MRFLRERGRLGTVLLLLLVLQFALRPLLGDVRIAPDFLFLALMVYAIRARPGHGAAAGFLVGLLKDALSPVAFGAGALAHTIVGYFAAWGKAVFFADNLFVNVAFFSLGSWLCDILVLLFGQHLTGAALFRQVVYLSPLKALTTATAGIVILLIFRRWLDIRIRE